MISFKVQVDTWAFGLRDCVPRAHLLRQAQLLYDLTPCPTEDMSVECAKCRNIELPNLSVWPDKCLNVAQGWVGLQGAGRVLHCSGFAPPWGLPGQSTGQSTGLPLVTNEQGGLSQKTSGALQRSLPAAPLDHVASSCREWKGWGRAYGKAVPSMTSRTKRKLPTAGQLVSVSSAGAQ